MSAAIDFCIRKLVESQPIFPLQFHQSSTPPPEFVDRQDQGVVIGATGTRVGRSSIAA